MELSTLQRFTWTLVLFTFTDFKTIVIPVTVFACAAAPVRSPARFIYGISWTWLHLLQVDVSNQYRSITEDEINRPWRPLPSGRISQQSSTIMRWLLVPICVATSIPFGGGVSLASLSLTALLIAHDELGFSGHWVTKNVINSLGYLSFEFGATTIMSTNPDLDRIAVLSLTCSSLLVLTTIHAQDFSDIEGDRAHGRVTLPIYAPKLSRTYTFLALGTWSVGLGYIWDLGPSSQMFLVLLGVTIGWRFYWCRTAADDGKTFIAYNLWLLLSHILPSHARWGVFRF
ncbi:UbiA prenyltransferase family [Mycena olivaceomarginata]|nr:UbiA prenyltransferase family [Mycena olivaceomarginata]